MLARIEILPTTEPFSEGRPSALAKSGEIRSRPSVMLGNCAPTS
jgi:hypothetical protein